jgi:O-antigen/teichoic acid export membrane protein
MLVTLLKKILPRWIRSYLLKDYGAEGLLKYFSNTSWSLGGRVVTFVTSFLTIAIVARYLGPENLGKLSYAQSYVAMFSVLASLGIDQILQRELTNNPRKHSELLGTTMIAKLFLGTLTFILATSISWVTGTEPLITLLVALTASSFLISPLSTIGIFFQSEAKEKYSSQVMIFNAFFIPAVKLAIIFFDKGIIYFAGALVLETLVGVLFLLFVYIHTYKLSPFAWKFSLTLFRSLLHQSWPLALASATSYVYSKMDQIMLMHYLDATAVGLYSAAVKLRDFATIIPGILLSSLLPAVLNSRLDNQKEYLKRVRSLGKIVCTFSMLIITPIFLFSNFFISTIFGNEFAQAGAILKIFIWTGIGGIIVAYFRTYLVAEYQTKHYFYATALGVVFNIVLNLLLIPPYGATGAATATLLTFVFVILILISSASAKKLFART